MSHSSMRLSHKYEWVKPRSHVTHEWVMSHTSESWVMPHIWISRESCHTYEWVLSHVTHMNKSWVMSRVWTGLYMLMCGFVNLCFLTRIWMGRTSWWELIVYVWRDSWLVHICDMTHGACKRATWHRDMTHICKLVFVTHFRNTDSQQRHDSFTCVTWLIHMRDMTHDTCIRVTWLRDMTRLYGRLIVGNPFHNTGLAPNAPPQTDTVFRAARAAALQHVQAQWLSHVTRINEARHTYWWVIRMSHVTHVNSSCHLCRLSFTAGNRLNITNSMSHVTFTDYAGGLAFGTR